jgi:hypothetical protein
MRTLKNDIEDALNVEVLKARVFFIEKEYDTDSQISKSSVSYSF